mmetsp:Transcript_43176/g.109047  ORF Transcript_43176/g.109047 Transcript_43176/m.109047 type:complete len:228 (+) Transcript_43176:465-1148(+)
MLHVQGHKRQRTKVGVARDCDAAVLAKLDQAGLLQVWVVLNLQDRHGVARVLQQVHQQGAVEVGHTNVLHKTCINQLLHRFPGLPDGDITVHQLSIGRVVRPLGRVARVKVHILQRDGEVDEVQVQLSQAEVFEGTLTSGAHMLACMEGVPQLGRDKHVLALHDTVLDGGGEARPHLLLISIVACAVQQTVPNLQGCLDRGCSLLLGNLPGAVPNKGHRRAGWLQAN